MGKNALGPGDVQDQVDQSPCVQGPEPGLPHGTDYALWDGLERLWWGLCCTLRVGCDQNRSAAETAPWLPLALC